MSASSPEPLSNSLKGSAVKKFLVPVVVALSVPFAPVAQAFPCAGSSPASWCAVRDEGSLSPYGGNSGPRSAKTDAADGGEPAIRFRIPGYRAPVQKKAAGDGVTPPIRFR